MSLDVVVSFDSTGSMYPCLSEVRRKVEEFIRTLFKQIPDLRIGLIAHGDYCDWDIYITKQLPLTTNVDELVNFVKRVQSTGGGGNGGECYERVLDEVSRFDWQADQKVLIMLGDEPPHKVGYTDWVGTGRHTVTLDWLERAKNLKSLGIKTYPVRCLNRSDSVRFHNELAALNEVPLLHLHQFSDILPFLTAIAYKQKSDEAVEEYGKELQVVGRLNRNIASMLNLLLGKQNLVGGADYATVPSDLVAVDPTRFQTLHVDSNIDIMSFVKQNGATFRKGKGFYELTKSELVQENKEVVLVDRKGDMFSGTKAREMIGLPYGQRGTIRPPRNLEYKVFVQSTSTNRKLIGNTMFLYEVDVR